MSQFQTWASTAVFHETEGAPVGVRLCQCLLLLCAYRSCAFTRPRGGSNALRVSDLPRAQLISVQWVSSALQPAVYQVFHMVHFKRLCLSRKGWSTRH